MKYPTTSSSSSASWRWVWCCLALVVVVVDSFSTRHSIPTRITTTRITTITTITTELAATLSVSEGKALPKRADELIEAVWKNNQDGGPLPIPRIAAACAPDVVWEDMRLPQRKIANGVEQVCKLLTCQYPRGTSLSIDKIADGVDAAGFTWTRSCTTSSTADATVNGQEPPKKLGLRGTTFVRLNDDGKIVSVQELAEPLYKPGDAMLKLLQAVTKNVPRPDKKKIPTYQEESPTSCSEIVDYVWNRAYPQDAPVDEAIKFYAPDIVYQDFNYPQPIRGLSNVEVFVREWGDFPGVEFQLQDWSDGDRACCFTWKVLVNGKPGPQGISFYETNGDGKITYIRDTPAPSFPPLLGKVARILRPKLRTFRSRKDLVEGIPPKEEDTADTIQ